MLTYYEFVDSQVSHFTVSFLTSSHSKEFQIENALPSGDRDWLNWNLKLLEAPWIASFPGKKKSVAKFIPKTECRGFCCLHGFS